MTSMIGTTAAGVSIWTTLRGALSFVATPAQEFNNSRALRRASARRACNKAQILHLSPRSRSSHSRVQVPHGQSQALSLPWFPRTHDRGTLIARPALGNVNGQAKIHRQDREHLLSRARGRDTALGHARYCRRGASCEHQAPPRQTRPPRSASQSKATATHRRPISASVSTATDLYSPVAFLASTSPRPPLYLLPWLICPCRGLRGQPWPWGDARLALDHSHRVAHEPMAASNGSST